MAAMATVQVDPAKVHEFKTREAFYRWLSKHHAKETEVWIKIHKVSSGLKSIIKTFVQMLKRGETVYP
jgi:uncharacterized protein YdeI (YjbR/CyaY-like superfamily)